jgi:hypothetical protein
MDCAAMCERSIIKVRIAHAYGFLPQTSVLCVFFTHTTLFCVCSLPTQLCFVCVLYPHNFVLCVGISVQFENITDPVTVTRFAHKKSTREAQIGMDSDLWTDYFFVHQYPLNLAFSLTIHKHQGQTLRSAVIDLEHTERTPAQAYVAATRVTSGNELYVIGYKTNSFLTDPEVVAFYNDMKKERQV